MSTALLMACEAGGGFSIEGPDVLASVKLFGIDWNLTESVVVQWVVMIILTVIFIVLGSGLKVIPTTRRQALAEMLVTTVNDMVDDGMGEKYRVYRPYIGVLFSYIVLCNLISLVGLRAPTADVSVTGTLAIITFMMTQYNRAKTGGVKG